MTKEEIINRLDNLIVRDKINSDEAMVGVSADEIIERGGLEKVLELEEKD